MPNLACIHTDGATSLSVSCLRALAELIRGNGMERMRGTSVYAGGIRKSRKSSRPDFEWRTVYTSTALRACILYSMVLHLGGAGAGGVPQGLAWGREGEEKDRCGWLSTQVTSVCPGERGAYVGTGVVGTELLCNSVSHAVSPAGVPWQRAASFPTSAFVAAHVLSVMT